MFLGWPVVSKTAPLTLRTSLSFRHKEDIWGGWGRGWGVDLRYVLIPGRKGARVSVPFFLGYLSVRFWCSAGLVISAFCLVPFTDPVAQSSILIFFSPGVWFLIGRGTGPTQGWGWGWGWGSLRQRKGGGYGEIIELRGFLREGLSEVNGVQGDHQGFCVLGWFCSCVCLFFLDEAKELLGWRCVSEGSDGMGGCGASQSMCPERERTCHS